MAGFAYCAMTSTYPLPFFPRLMVPPCLARGSPIKSSMLPAPLTAVGGRDGGAECGPSDGARSPLAATAGEPARAGVSVRDGGPGCGPARGVGCETWIGGVAVCPVNPLGIGGTGGVAPLDMAVDGGPPAPLTALLGGPLGGGALGTSVAVGAGPFLLTHFFRSLS